MSREPLEKEVRARVSRRTYTQLEAMLQEEEEGITISDLVRRAIRDYIKQQDPEQARAAQLRAADDEEL